jgi:cyclase
MRNVRLIARLDVKAPNLVKGYYEQGIDEILYIDIVASLYERNSLLDLIKQTTQDIFVPITVGGGLRSIEDVAAALRAGADKVAINTAAIKNPQIITDISQRFGSQCMVLSIQAKRNGDHWEAYYDCGREHSNLNAVEWAQRGEALGAGEILLTSVDKEGTGKGFDLDLVKAVTDKVNIPVIASGGMGDLEHFAAVTNIGHADAVAMAHVLHYNHLSVNEIRQHAINNHIPVRCYEVPA